MSESIDKVSSIKKHASDAVKKTVRKETVRKEAAHQKITGDTLKKPDEPVPQKENTRFSRETQGTQIQGAGEPASPADQEEGAPKKPGHAGFWERNTPVYKDVKKAEYVQDWLAYEMHNSKSPQDQEEMKMYLSMTCGDKENYSQEEYRNAVKAMPEFKQLFPSLASQTMNDVVSTVDPTDKLIPGTADAVSIFNELMNSDNALNEILKGSGFEG